MSKVDRRLADMDQHAAYAWAARLYQRMSRTPLMTPKRKRLAVQHVEIGYRAATEYPA